MDSRTESSEVPRSSRNKCAACYRQYNKMEHLVEHMKVSYHSEHEPRCGVCMKHCRSFESLREHLIGPLPKADCASVFNIQGCNLCLNIFDSENSLQYHRESCLYSPAPGFILKMIRLGFHSPSDNSMYVDFASRREPKVVAMSCMMVGGGTHGSLDLCARVCLVDQDENIVFHSYVRPQIPVTNHRYATTGIRVDHLRNALPLKHVQRKIQDFLCNGEAMWKIRSMGGNARILVGHGLDHDLECLGIEYPSVLIRDIASYPPLMKTSKLSNSLKHLTQTYLGYEIQSGAHDPYENSVAAMRLYLRMCSQVHDCPTPGKAPDCNAFMSVNQEELEGMSPSALMELSVSDYHCWCLDSKV